MFEYSLAHGLVNTNLIVEISFLLLQEALVGLAITALKDHRRGPSVLLVPLGPIREPKRKRNARIAQLGLFAILRVLQKFLVLANKATTALGGNQKKRPKNTHALKVMCLL